MTTKRVNTRRVTSAIVLAVLLAATWSLSVTDTPAGEYEGSRFCAECHPAEFNQWKVSGHPYKLVESSIAKHRPIPLPEGYTWDDISYVIGGYKWKTRFMGVDGYIITSIRTEEGEVDGKNQYNMLTGRWVDYHAGERKPYDCGRCHTTGYSPDGRQDDLPGIVGTWEFGGIHCEACHGPAWEMSIDRSAAACGKCHSRGSLDTIPAKGGFIRHHEQYNEILASPHANLACVDCHNPHKKSEFSIAKSCESCHPEVAAGYIGDRMQIAGVTCTDCHMPMASRSAEALGPHKGDIKSHLFRINPAEGAELFTDDGMFVDLDEFGQAAVTLKFACMNCHRDIDPSVLAGEAANFHQKPRRVFSVTMAE